MISFTTPAYMLRSVDVGATDRLYTLYTRDRGKIDVIAKGIRKNESKLQASMQFGCELEVYIIAQRRFTLGGSVIREHWPRIFSSLPSLWSVQHACDALNTLTQQEHPDKKLFDFFKEYMQTIGNQKQVRPERLLYATVSFDLHVLGILGHAPALGAGAETDDRYALRAGGLHAKKEISGLPYHSVTKEGRALLRFAQQNSIEDCFRVAVTMPQVQVQRSYVRALLEEYNASSLPSDRTVKDFFGS